MTEDVRTGLVGWIRTLAPFPAPEVAFGETAPPARDWAPLSDTTSAPLAERRGKADALGFLYRYHDFALHDQLAPSEGEAAALFDALEKARVEARGAAAYPGGRRNLTAALEADLSRRGFDRCTDLRQIPAPVMVHALARMTFSAESGGAALASLRTLTAPVYARHREVFDALAKRLSDQRAFAEKAGELLVAMGVEGGESIPSAGAAKDEAPSSAPEENADGEEGQEEARDDSTGRGEEAAAGDADGDGDLNGAAGDMAAGPSARRKVTPDGEGYRVFSRAYDEVVRPPDLASAADLARLRQDLDDRLSGLRRTVNRLAHRLQRELMARQRRWWAFNQEEGVLDTGRLARIVADPGHRLSFRREVQAPFPDTVVTLLVDNSGSMRGRPITIAAMCSDILARTLELCGVRVEILGFTTRGWRGGETGREWERAGRPAAPGRLNDLRHIIYKSADTPWRRGRRGLGLMLMDGLLKENIDGEALLWAAGRLLRRPEERRILLAISDGAPVDDATLSANGNGYLDAHLKQVVRHLETESPLEVSAIGIGHDVSRHYRRAVRIQTAEDLGPVLMEELSALFAYPTRPRSRVPTPSGASVFV